MPLQDLDAYLRRLGLDASAALAEIHRAHATTIPFENFDPLSGRGVALDLERLEEKMVANRRGGYCFEHNLLLQAALQSLGYEVVPMLARVRMGASGGPPGPLNHLLLQVIHEGTTWLADVGLGGGGILDPIPFEAGREHDQSGWRYRLVPEGDELVLQVFRDGGWFDFYSFVPKPAVFADIEVGNWYTSTSPKAGFVTGLFAGARRVDRCLSLFASDRATVVERPVGGESSTTEVAFDEVPGILEERFGLPGVHLDDEGRLRITEPAA